MAAKKIKEDLIGEVPKKQKAAKIIPLGVKPKTLELSQLEANKMAIQHQLVYIKLLRDALKYSYKGESYLFGNRVYFYHVAQAQNKLVDMDRLQTQLEGKNKLPYFNSPGSTLDKVKDHYDSDGTIAFVEMIPGSTGKKYKVHTQAIGTIKKQIKQKQMAVKKKAAKKAAVKKTAPAAKAKAGSIRATVETLVNKGKSNEQILAHFKANKIKASENSLRWYASKARAAIL